jgi:hypothetical protein
MQNKDFNININHRIYGRTRSLFTKLVYFSAVSEKRTILSFHP